MIQFGEYRPDVEAVDANVLVDARNVRPLLNGYAPFPSLQGTTDPVPSRPFGASTVLKDDGSEFFAGTSTKLYNLTSTGWTDATRTTGGDYSLPVGAFWNYEVFGTTFVAHHIGDDVQKFTLDSSSRFEALGGNPPRARYSMVVNNFLVLGSLVGNKRKIRWSGLNDAEEWTIGVNQSDEQEFPDGGPILGLSGGEIGYIFQRNAIRRMIYLPGDPRIFQIDVVERDRGILAAGSIARIGSVVYYLSQNGFFRFDGQQSVPIGAEKINELVLSDVSDTQLIRLRSSVDPVNNLVIWAYVSLSSSGEFLDKQIVYDWVLEKWSIRDEPITDLFRFISVGFSLEDLDSISASLDTLPVSLDSPFWQGGKASLGGFTTDFRLGFFTGPNLEATLETSDFQPVDNGRGYISEITPIINAPTATVEIGYRERKADAITWTTANGLELNGTVPAHVEGKYMRGRFKVAAGDIWDRAQGFEVDARPAGSQ